MIRLIIKNVYSINLYYTTEPDTLTGKRFYVSDDFAFAKNIVFNIMPDGSVNRTTHYNINKFHIFDTIDSCSDDYAMMLFHADEDPLVGDILILPDFDLYSESESDSDSDSDYEYESQLVQFQHEHEHEQAQAHEYESLLVQMQHKLEQAHEYESLLVQMQHEHEHEQAQAQAHEYESLLVQMQHKLEQAQAHEYESLLVQMQHKLELEQEQAENAEAALLELKHTLDSALQMQRTEQTQDDELLIVYLLWDPDGTSPHTIILITVKKKT